MVHVRLVADQLKTKGLPEKTSVSWAQEHQKASPFSYPKVEEFDHRKLMEHLNNFLAQKSGSEMGGNLNTNFPKIPEMPKWLPGSVCHDQLIDILACQSDQHCFMIQNLKNKPSTSLIDL